MSARILDKGNYTGHQHSRFLTVEQYLIAEEDGKRYLLLRLCNGSGEVVTGFRLEIFGYTDDGRPIGKREYVYGGPPVAPAQIFGPTEKIPLSGACARVRVEVLSVRSHDYVYEVKKSGIRVKYLPETEPPDREKLSRKTGGRRSVVVSGVGRSKRVLFLVVAALALTIGAFSLFRNFGKEEGEEEEAVMTEFGEEPC